MNIVKVVFSCFLILAVVLDVFAMKKEKKYGDPFTRYVLAGKVEAIFSRSNQCVNDSGILYRLRVEEVLRGGGRYESVLILAPNESDFVNISDRQIVFLMNIDSSIPDSVRKCYQTSAFDMDEDIGHVDHVSAEGIFKIIENSSGEDLVYSAHCSDKPQISLSDKVFDGQSYPFSTRVNSDSTCNETIGFLSDLIKLSTESFSDVSIKPNDTVSEASIEITGQR